MPSNLRTDRDLVLVENTAQAVFKHLDRIKDGKSEFGTRWIWELLQNARDAAGTEPVKISIQLGKSRLIFRHNGRPFSSKEASHLIYHGSTKVDSSVDIGRFGSGFLSTHLISPIVSVRGCLDDGCWFAFQLDRSGLSVEELHSGMDRSFDEFEKSATNGGESLDCYTTEFGYPLSDDTMAQVTAGIQQLRNCAALVLAFCPEIGEVEVCSETTTWSAARGSVEQVAPTVHLHSTKIANDGVNSVEFAALALAKVVQLCAVAVPLRQAPNSLEIFLEDVPRFFILLPLIGTERLSLPGVINCLAFKPREDRNGIVLSGDSEGASQNRDILDAASEAFARLLECAAELHWERLEHIVHFEVANTPDWIDRAWFTEYLRPLLQLCRRTPILSTQSGGLIPPERAWIPVGNDSVPTKALGDLLGGLVDAETKLPHLSTISTWSQNLASWARLTNQPVESFPEAMTLERLAKLAGTSNSVKALQDKLKPDRPALEWLGALIQHIHRSGNTKLLDDYSLLPTQAGGLRRRHEIKVDQEIDAELKEIAHSLGFPLRDILLSSELCTKDTTALLPSMTKDEAAAEVIGRYKVVCNAGRIPITHMSAAVRLFYWIVEGDGWVSRLTGFPVATEESNERDVAVIELIREQKDEDRPLAPIANWPSELSAFASLFAKRRTLNALYDLENWIPLGEAGFLHPSPLFKTRKPLEELLCHELLESTDPAKAHESSERVEVSDIALLRTKDIGLLDAARNSRVRAVQLVALVLTISESLDREGFELSPVPCACGLSHSVLHASWLAPMYARAWVPIDADGRRAARVNAEALAGLLGGDPDLVRRVSTGYGALLLRTLRISVADFALRFIAKDEATRVSLIHSMSDLAKAAGGDLKRVGALVAEIGAHPELITAIEQGKAQRERVARNQKLGALVEALFRSELERRGLRVSRTGVGSDFEVDSDFIEDGHEVALTIEGQRSSTLIELKATATDWAKMTPRQAEAACREKERFALCVVPVTSVEPDEQLVRETARFVFGIGDQVAPLWNQYVGIQDANSLARGHSGPVEMQMEDGTYRFCVSRQIWSAGLTFAQAVERLSAMVTSGAAAAIP